MENEKVTKLLKRIDRAFAELAKVTGAKHISAAYVQNALYIEDLTDLKDPKFWYYKNKKGEVTTK